jgi:hypothetical protein
MGKRKMMSNVGGVDRTKGEPGPQIKKGDEKLKV